MLVAVLRRPIPVAILIGLIAEALFAWHLTRPSTLVFDETHYVPAARALLTLSGPTNIEHPLLAKIFIATGIDLFGDNPMGWRFLSTLAGVAALEGLFAIAWLLTGRLRIAVLASAFALLNFTLFVQARIAMLDGYMAAFTLLALAALLWAVTGEARWKAARWALGSILLGLAIGCKWAALPFGFYVGLGVLWLAWKRPERLAGLGLVAALAILAIGSAAAYLATFAPAFFYYDQPLTLSTLLPFQATMYAEQVQVLPPHTYQSPWWSWPVDRRPIWYLYEVTDGAQRGILMIGNPAVFWGGLIAIPACLWLAIRERSARIAAAAGLWVGSYAMWAIIPKSLGFMYYYYLPSILICLPLAITLDRAGQTRLGRFDELYGLLCVGLFGYFYPILSAASLSGPSAFHHWTWFNSWI